jgi:hypothetical protein
MKRNLVERSEKKRQDAASGMAMRDVWKVHSSRESEFPVVLNMKMFQLLPFD